MEAAGEIGGGDDVVWSRLIVAEDLLELAASALPPSDDDALLRITTFMGTSPDSPSVET